MRILSPSLIMLGMLVWPFMGSAATPSMPIDVLFNDPIEDNNFVNRGWYDGPEAYTVTMDSDNAAVNGSSASIAALYQQGETKPSWVNMRHSLLETENVYLSFYVKYSSNWVGSGLSYHPHEFCFLTNKSGVYAGGYGQELTLYVEQNGLTPRTAYANPGNVNGVFHDSITTDIEVNRWYRVEAFFKLNTMTGSSGNSDGIIKYWLDGELLVDVDDALFRDGSNNTDMMINQLIFQPYMGNGSPVTQTMWVDDLIVGTENPDAGGAIPNPPSSLAVE